MSNLLKELNPLKKKLRKIFLQIKNKKKDIIGYGVTAKSTTILNYCDIGKNLFLILLTQQKINKISIHLE